MSNLFALSDLRPKFPAVETATGFPADFSTPDERKFKKSFSEMVSA